MEAVLLPLSAPVTSGGNASETTRKRWWGCAVRFNNGGWNMQHHTSKAAALRFTQAFGQASQTWKSVVHFQLSKGVSGDRGSRRAVTARAPFTERQESLVKETWKELKKDAGNHALAVFMRVFEIAPSAKRLFSFLKDSDVPLEKNPKLKSHALKVFVIICEAATSLRNKGHVSTPGSTMKDMAHSHMVSGVVMEHYEVVKFCLLKTLEEGLPAEQWNEEVKEAWSVAYDELVDAINAEAAATPA